MLVSYNMLPNLKLNLLFAFILQFYQMKKDNYNSTKAIKMSCRKFWTTKRFIMNNQIYDINLMENDNGSYIIEHTSFPRQRTNSGTWSMSGVYWSRTTGSLDKFPFVSIWMPKYSSSISDFCLSSSVFIWRFHHNHFHKLTKDR